MNNIIHKKKLSHIIFYVDKNYCNEALCAYCTNMSTKEEDFSNSIISYVNQNTNERCTFSDILENHNIKCKREEVFVITDNAQMCKKLSEEKFAFAGLITEYNKNESFRYALYCIEDLEEIPFDTLFKMWQRFNELPWTICETKRTVIREQIIEDVDRLYEIYSDPSTTEYMDDLYRDRDEEIQYMKDYISNQYRFCEYGIWTILDKNTGIMIGRAGLSQRAGYEELELGYVIAAEYRNKGYCFEVLEAIIDYMIDNYGIESLIAFVRKNNEASIALLKKLTFECCGIENIDGKEHFLYRRILTKRPCYDRII